MEKITETTKATEVEEAVSSQETIPQQEEPQEEKAQFDKELFKRSVLYNILTTVLTGGVSMVIFFVINKMIFPEGEAKQ